VWIALVDEDPEYDDLIGIGIANERGEFRLTFTAEAFNQEVGETEARPDLYLVASIQKMPGINVPVLRKDYRGLRFDAEEDLGLVTLPIAKGAEPPYTARLRAAPGATKLVRRIHLDDEIVAHAAREVVPIVESLTGWSNLLDGIQLAVVDDFHELQERELATHLGRRLTAEERVLAAERAEGCDVNLMALWDNRERTIFLNRAIMEAQNYDALKVVLGHELVHVGQSQHHPDVDAAITAFHRQALERLFSGGSYAREELNELTRFMANLEGYAAHVEEALLEVFTHGATILSSKLEARQRSLQRRRATEVTAADMKELLEKSWREILEASASRKSNQYEAGRRAYRERAPGRAVARFDPAFRPELHFAEEMLRVLRSLAEGGHCVSQYELGVLYRDGTNGVSRDVEQAKEWFRKAATAGLAVAGQALASLEPEGAVDRMSLLRAGAEQGLASSQHLYGAELLNLGHREGVAWIEKAAEQGLAAAMEALATIYEKGIVVPRDIVKGRVWKKRAAAKS
jgi:TPR repeat protein